MKVRRVLWVGEVAPLAVTRAAIVERTGAECDPPRVAEFDFLMVYVNNETTAAVAPWVRAAREGGIPAVVCAPGVQDTPILLDASTHVVVVDPHAFLGVTEELPAEFLRELALSEREEQVLRLALVDLGDRAIAAKLGCAHGTVRTYWSRIQRKAHQNSRSGVLALIARMALRRLVVRPDVARIERT